MDPTTSRSQLHFCDWYERFFVVLIVVLDTYFILLAMVTITALQRNVSRQDIECPGDTIPYRCSVQSNSETVQLNWMVTFPGQDTIIMVLYTNDSSRNAVTFLPMNLTARLTQYEVDQNVESELVLTVLQTVPMNGTILECRSEDLASENETVYVNTEGIWVIDVWIH